MIGMMIQSTAVTFGAVGTSILVGVRGGLENPELIAHLTATGRNFEGYLNTIAANSPILHGITGTLIPLLMIMMMTRFFGKNRSWTEGLSIAPFAIFGGLAFTIPYALTGIFLGPEFPSLIGALIGLAIVTFAAHKGFLIPKDNWDFAPVTEWESDWVGSIEIKLDSLTDKKMPIWLAWAPYLLVSVFLVLSRLPQLGIGKFLKLLIIRWSFIFNTQISASTTSLYLPGTILILVVLFTFLFHRMKGSECRKSISDSTKIILSAGFVLIFTVPMVRILY